MFLMMKLSSLSFLIPAYNDEATITRVVAEAVAVGKRVAKKFEVVVTSDGSQDMTRIILVRLAKKVENLRVITHRVNQGYGRTIKELYYAGKSEWLFSIPGDYQVGARELEAILRATPTLWSGESRSSSRQARTIYDVPDMILGWRVARHDPVNRLFASWVYNSLLRLLFGITLHDVNSVRLMRRAVLKDIALTSDSAFVDAELVIGALRNGFRVTEAPIAHRPRQGGGQGRGNGWKTVWETAREMIQYYQYYQ